MFVSFIAFIRLAIVANSLFLLVPFVFYGQCLIFHKFPSFSIWHRSFSRITWKKQKNQFFNLLGKQRNIVNFSKAYCDCSNSSQCPFSFTNFYEFKLKKKIQISCEFTNRLQVSDLLKSSSANKNLNVDVTGTAKRKFSHHLTWLCRLPFLSPDVIQLFPICHTAWLLRVNGRMKWKSTLLKKLLLLNSFLSKPFCNCRDF